MIDNTRPVVVFRRLTLANILAALLFRVFGRNVIFIEPLGVLRSLVWMRRLEAMGIRWFDFHACDGYRGNADLATAAMYADRIFRKAFSSKDIDNFVQLIPGAPITISNARALLYDNVASKIVPRSMAYALAEHFQDNGIKADVFHRYSVADALIGAYSVTDVKNLYPGWFLSLVFNAANLGNLKRLIKFIKILYWRTARISQSMAAGDNCTTHDSQQTPKPHRGVLYFPHKGLSYGTMFVKDQYYSPVQTSPFNQNNIEHIELELSEQEQQDVAEDYKRHSVSVTFVNQRRHLNWDIIFQALRRLGHMSVSTRAFAKMLIAVQCARSTEAFRRSFQSFEGARIALLGYEFNFPKAAAVALQSMGIKVVAAQERLIFAFHKTFAPILDVYFVHGDVAKARIEENPYASVSRIAVTGDARTNKISSSRDGALKERDERFGTFAHVCLALDYHSAPDPFVNATRCITDWKSNEFFYQAIANLAASNPDCAFIIRSKNLDWMEISYMREARAMLSALNNVFVDSAPGSLMINRPYALAAMADLVIGRYTSLCDQCLAEGIPTLIYEALPNDERSTSYVHDFAPYPVLIDNEADLRDRFSQIVRHNFFMNNELFANFRRTYYNAGEGGGAPDPFECLQMELDNIYQELGPDVTSDCVT